MANKEVSNNIQGLKESLRLSLPCVGGSNMYSNTPCPYSQWLNSVIYWLIYHCTDRAQTGVTSFVASLNFHDVIYHVRHCSIDNRRRNVVFITAWRSKCT